GLLIGAVLLMGGLAVGYHIDFSRAMDEAQRELDVSARDFVESTESQRTFRRLSVQFLGSTPAVQGVVRAVQNAGTDPLSHYPQAHWEQQLQQIFSSYLESTPDVYRASLVAMGRGAATRE